MKENTSNILLVIGSIVVIAIGLLAFAWLIYEIDEPQRESCSALCVEYDAIFIEYEAGFFSASECWCKSKLNEPIRVK